MALPTGLTLAPPPPRAYALAGGGEAALKLPHDMALGSCELSGAADAALRVQQLQSAQQYVLRRGGSQGAPRRLLLC